MTEFCALQGVPSSGKVPFVFLSLNDTQILWNGQEQDCPAYTVLTLEADCEQSCTLQLPGSDKVYKFKARKDKLHKDMWFRSCDAAIMPFRDRVISALAEKKPRILWTIGDLVYADFFVSISGSLTNARCDYFRAWCHTLGPLMDITLHCTNLIVPDDHEVWDNWTSLNEFTKQGFHLLQEVYQGLMGKWRASCTRLLPVRNDPHIQESLPINAYDSYSFVVGHGSVMFIVLATWIHEMAGALVSQALCYPEANKIKHLIVVSNKPRLITRVSLPGTFYSCCAGNPEPPDASPSLFDTLHQLAMERPHLGITFIAGDYHVGLQTYVGKIRVIVTSPFSGVGLPGDSTSQYLLPVDSQNKWISDANFYSLMRDQLVTVPLSTLDHWQGRGSIVSAKLCPRF